MLYNLSICVSDIPKDRIKKSEKNGKSYLNITVSDKQSPDQFGNDATVYISQTKEEKGNEKKYIGQGKKVVFNNAPSAPAATNNTSTSNSSDDGLPF